MEFEEKQKLTKTVESLFGTGAVADDSDMWNTFSQFAAQFDEMQIMALLRLSYIANICHEPTKTRINSFVTQYKAIWNNRGTLMPMIRMGEISSLQRFFRGIDANIKVDK